MMIMLDTTACIDYLNGDPKIKEVLFRTEKNNLLGITTITVYEISIGLERTKRKISETRYEDLYKKWIEFLSGIEIFPLNIKEAERAAQVSDNLDAKGEKIDDNDILIAGIMLSNGITKILTRNTSHFEKIEGLEIITY